MPHRMTYSRIYIIMDLFTLIYHNIILYCITGIRNYIISESCPIEKKKIYLLRNIFPLVYKKLLKNVVNYYI